MEQLDSYNGNTMIESAGFVIIDFRKSEPKVLCLYNEWGSWDFPKGRLEAGESTFDAAVRETREECDLDLLSGDYVPIDCKPLSVTYRSGNETKVATYFFAERVSDTTPNIPVNPKIGKPEHIMWEWVNASSLYRRMPARLAGIVGSIERMVEMKPW
jgi:8-oxo-dGTP pyrophosphatase MutT (NUDIX family)